MKSAAAKSWRGLRLAGAGLIGLTMLAVGAFWYLAQKPTAQAGQFINAADAELNFCDLKLAFEDEFDTLSVAPDEIGTNRWIAHTPWDGDFGDAAFADPEPDFPFTVKDGILSIEARKDGDGKWRAGLLSSADAQQRGFTQTFGYFEARMKLPDGPGVWPAFWLVESEPPGRTEPNVEIDIIEYYGHKRDVYNSSLHVWHRVPSRWVDSRSRRMPVAAGSLSADFHTFGVKITQQTVTYYFDRTPYWQVHRPKAQTLPFMLLVNLAAGSGHPIDRMPNPSVLEVDYVKAWALAPGNILGLCEG